MFSLHSFFPILPSEEAIRRRQQALERADNEGFCRQLVSQIVNSVDVPDIVPITWRPGRPPGTFDVAFFCRRLVERMLETATTRIEQSTRTKKVYQTWSDAERVMALQLAFDKGSDSHAVSLLTTLFPATLGSLRESHIRYFRQQEASKNAPRAEYHRGNMISGGALQDVVACIDAHVQAKLEFTGEEIRCIVIPLLKEKHPHVLARGFIASITWLNNLTAQHMKLPMRRLSTPSVPMPLSDDAEQKHRLVLYRLAYLVATHGIPRALVVNCNQSALNLFPGMGLRRAPKGTHTVDGHGADDNRTVSIGFGIAADGSVLPPQIILEGTTKLPAREFRRVHGTWLVVVVQLQPLVVHCIGLGVRKFY